MPNLIFFLILALTVSCGFDGSGGKSEVREVEEFEISIEAELGQDHGQGLGTLFTAYDSAGHVLLGAGFQDSFSTYIRDNNRMLAFYCTGRNEPIQIEAIGKPFGDDVNAARLIADNGVFAFYYDDPVQINSNFGIAADWMPNGLFGIQYVGDKRLVMLDDYEKGPLLTLDGQVIFSPGENFLFYYSNGIVVIFLYNPSRILIGPHDFYQEPFIDIHKFTEFSIYGFPYIFGTYNDEVIISTNLGAVYSYKKNELKILREYDGKSFQLYSAIKVYDQLFLGHYPSGSIYVYDGNGLREFPHPLPVPLNVNKRQREAQTLCLFNGDLYVGVWPWGELWRFNFDSSTWQFVDRLYDFPEMSPDVISPYHKEMVAIGGIYNYWGQRITNMVPYGGSLYISTMNKGAFPYIPEQHSFISEESLEQYGQIHRLSGPLQITSPISWRTKSIFRFKISRDKMSMTQDDELLQELEIDALKYGCGKVESVTVGHGVFGTFGGHKIVNYSRSK